MNIKKYNNFLKILKCHNILKLVDNIICKISVLYALEITLNSTM